jgi:3-methyladenine DNA glycosylase AlkC
MLSANNLRKKLCCWCMKINLEIEISEEVVQLLAKNIKKEDTEAYIKELLTQTVNQFLAKIPEVYVALHSGVVEQQEIFTKANIDRLKHR